MSFKIDNFSEFNEFAVPKFFGFTNLYKISKTSTIILILIFQLLFTRNPSCKVSPRKISFSL